MSMGRLFHTDSMLFACAIFLFLALSPFGTSAQLSAAAPKDAAAPPAVYAQKISVAGVPNAGQISEILFRGAQPGAVGLVQLKQLGITTIVDLRGGLDVVSERERAEALGFRFVDIPVSGWAPPSDEQVAQFLSLVRDIHGERIFGGDRTGDDRRLSHRGESLVCEAGHRRDGIRPWNLTFANSPRFLLLILCSPLFRPRPD